MIIECGHCGAPLDAKEGASITRCAYCKQSNRVDAQRTLHAQTPANWSPPPRWRPPPHVPASSAVELAYAPARRAAAVVLAAYGLVAVGAAAAGFLAVRKGVGPGGVRVTSGLAVTPAASFATVDLKESPRALAAALPGSTLSDHMLRASLAAPLSYVVVHWTGSAAHPTGFGFYTGATACDATARAVRDGLSAALGKRFDGGLWHWGRLSMNFDPHCSYWSVTMGSGDPLSNEPDAVVEARLEVAWALVRKLTLDVGTAPSEASVRDALAKGYELEAVAAAVGPSTIDDVATVKSALPATLSRSIAGLELNVPLAHPRFADLEVRYVNAKAGGIDSLRFVGPGNHLDAPNDVGACLAQALGAKLTIDTTDYVNKKTQARLESNGARVGITEYGVFVNASGFGAISPKAAAALFGAVARCAH